MKWKQSLLWLVLLLGIGLLSYPLISKVFNDHSSAAAIAQFRQCLMETDTATERALAETYNLGLLHTGAGEGDYEKILNISQGIMGYLKIPKIHVSLPIYHGTRQEVLGKGVGHLPESALPIGGRGNHTVLTGHTGLPSARLLTDLSQLEEGDLFLISVLDEELTYQVEQIQVVLPEEGDALLPEPDQDLCTLVTCTPYGINSHRLLVRGRRVEDENDPQ